MKVSRTLQPGKKTKNTQNPAEKKNKNKQNKTKKAGKVKSQRRRSTPDLSQQELGEGFASALGIKGKDKQPPDKTPMLQDTPKVERKPDPGSS